MARILIIDDEELTRFTLREILDGVDHEVVEAKSGNLNDRRERSVHNPKGTL